MDERQAVAVRRPQRWDQPFDACMSDDDVRWLRSRHPFAAMRDAAFPSATPLAGILKNDCRLRRCSRGEVVVREGDYGNSAFLVLSGSVRVALESLPPESLGRQSTNRRLGWWDALAQLWRRPRLAEVRERASVTAEGQARVESIDDRQAIFLQDYSAVFTGRKSVTLGPGELFGEVAAMYRTPQSATVVAEDEATLVEIRWQGLRLLRRDQAFADQMEQHYRANWLVSHLRETPLLRFLSDEAIQRVAGATQMRSYGRMEWQADFQKARTLPVAQQIEHEPLIAIEGHWPTDLILIRTGFARVSTAHGAGHQTTAYLGKGHMFGFRELVHNALRPEAAPPRSLQHSLRAVGFVDALHIPAEIFAAEILPYIRRDELPTTIPSLTRHDANETTDRRRTPREKPGDPAAAIPESAPVAVTTATLEFLVQQRLTNGRRAMVIDLDRCTRCDDCVRACAVTHGGNPRMMRTGPVHDRLQFAQVCMHCTDPVCMIGCPTGAISRDELTGTISITEPICIGCGMCAASCPYQAISLVEIRDAAGRVYQDQHTGLPIVKATKCDLCQSQPSGPACTNACPHDALVRIDLSQIGPLDQWLGRRR